LERLEKGDESSGQIGGGVWRRREKLDGQFGELSNLASDPVALGRQHKGESDAMALLL